MTISKEDREIVAADVLELVKKLRADEREDLIKEIAEEVMGRGDMRTYAQMIGSPVGASTSVATDVPMGFRWQADPFGNPTAVQIFPRKGFLNVRGVRSFNEPGEIWIDYLQGGVGFDISPDGFDSASFSLTHGAFKDAPVERHLAYYRAPWGVISLQNPLTVTFKTGHLAPKRPEGAPWLNWTLYGEWVQSWDSDYTPPKGELPEATDEDPPTKLEGRRVG